MKAIPDRKFTVEFRNSAIQQVLIEGERRVAKVARSLEMSDKTLANWALRARKGQAMVKRAARAPIDEMTARMRVYARRTAVSSQEGGRDSKKGQRRTLQGSRCEYAWIEKNRDQFGVTMMSRVLGVSPSGLYSAVNRKTPARQQSNERMVVEIGRRQRRHLRLLRAPTDAPRIGLRLAAGERKASGSTDA